MEKPTICIGENQGADQLRSTAILISAFIFASRIVQFLYFLNPKFPASNDLLLLYSPVCVRPGRNPNCWFSHAKVQYIEHTKQHRNAYFDFAPGIATFRCEVGSQNLGPAPVE